MTTFGPVKLARMLSLVITALWGVVAAASPPSAHYAIGTGSRGATFYPMTEVLCRHINQRMLDFTCEAVVTEGSHYNLRALENGQLDLALSQANLQYLASQGMSPFTTTHENIRTVAPLHREVFVLAVRAGSGIGRFADIKGRRINIGNVGSGSRLIVEHLFEFLNWKLAEFKVYSSKSSDLPALLCEGDIDAAIYSTGHPNTIYQRLLQCGVGLVDVWNKRIARFVEENPEYGPALIPGSTYLQEPEQIHGFGVQVVLSAHRDVPAAHVARIVQALVDGRETLAESAPIYTTVEAAAAIEQPIAPYHEGVRLYVQQYRRP